MIAMVTNTMMSITSFFLSSRQHFEMGLNVYGEYSFIVEHYCVVLLHPLFHQLTAFLSPKSHISSNYFSFTLLSHICWRYLFLFVNFRTPKTKDKKLLRYCRIVSKQMKWKNRFKRQINSLSGNPIFQRFYSRSQFYWKYQSIIWSRLRIYNVKREKFMYNTEPWFSKCEIWFKTML